MSTAKKRVLLILPPNVTEIEPFRSAVKKHAPQAIGFPLGLGYLASYLRREGNYELKIIDANKDNLSIADICEVIENFDPHYIGLSIFTIISKVAVQLAKQIKTKFKDKIIIAGGPHASDDYHNLLSKYPYFDFVVVGEGEITLSELLAALDTGNEDKVRAIKGIAYIDRLRGEVIFTGGRASQRNIDQFPAPARNLVDFESYIRRDNLLPYSVELMTSRGCTHRCVFCSFQKSWRTRATSEIVAEMKDLISRYPRIRSFIFYDDNFSADPQRVIELCKTFINEKLDRYSWSCLCRPDQVTVEMMTWMKKAGCTKINFGAESADPGILKNLNKKLKPEQIKWAAEAATKLGINAMVFFIIGSPGEEPRTIDTTYRFAKKLKCQSTVWSMMQVYPGTALAKMQPCDDFVAYLYEPEVEDPCDSISANAPVFLNPGLDRETLKRIYKRIFRNIAFYKAFQHPVFLLNKIFRAPLPALKFFLLLMKRK